MKKLFHCLNLFVGWLQGGLYDFSSLPMSVFSHLRNEDMDAIMKAHTNYSGKLAKTESTVLVVHTTFQ